MYFPFVKGTSTKKGMDKKLEREIDFVSVNDIYPIQNEESLGRSSQSIIYHQT